MAEPSPDDPLPTSVSPQAILFPTLALLSTILTLISIVAQLYIRNVPIIALFLSLTIKNLLNAINAILYNNDNTASWWLGVGWCQLDITLQYGTFQAIIGVPPAILRYLSHILDVDNISVTPSKRHRRFQLAVEIFICIILPIIVTALTPITLGYRYRISGLIGCVPFYLRSPWRLLVITSFIFLAILPGLFYGCKTAIKLYQYRRRNAMLFSSIQSHTSKSRFIRLLIVSTAILIGGTITTSIAFVAELGFVLQPSAVSASDSAQESELGRPIVFAYGHGSLPIGSWVVVAAGFACFMVLGTGSEMLGVYKMWLRKLGFRRRSTLDHSPT